ncbi:hypothetical protein ACHAWF_010518 [Thalassiosira exigua]
MILRQSQRRPRERRPLGLRVRRIDGVWLGLAFDAPYFVWFALTLTPLLMSNLHLAWHECCVRCGWPLKSGDMYGGSHYIVSAAADMTPQGRAILEAAHKFGDGKTLPFPPCKRYYNPFRENGTRMYACRQHNELRIKRLKKEAWKWRCGEKCLDDFWAHKTNEEGEKNSRINARVASEVTGKACAMNDNRHAPAKKQKVVRPSS